MVIGKLVRAALLFSVLLATSCGSSATTPAQPAAAAAQEEPAISSPAQPVPVEPLVAPVESGFAHCCGNADFRLQIRCSDRLMRCYENGARGDWKQTYGRHCKRERTEACYLEGCLDTCSPIADRR
jgi:hypothetical protein